jgi:SAM-dependent methyltransferase
MTFISPADYDAWYRTPRGAWMGEAEAKALIRIGGLGRGRTVLDVGCGSGWFSRRFAAEGCAVTGLDPDPAMLTYARRRPGEVRYLRGRMETLPFPDRSFDVVTAVTSLCFVADQCAALREMARVARRAVVLGLLHRRSLLYLMKRDRGAYRGAHWYTRAEARAMTECLGGLATETEMESLLAWPGGPAVGRVVEWLPTVARCGAFLTVIIRFV